MHRPVRPAAIPLVSALALAVLAAGALGAQQPDLDAPPPPDTRVDTVVDTLHGVPVPDPYRWLEDKRDEDTRAWIGEQNAYTDSILASCRGGSGSGSGWPG